MQDLQQELRDLEASSNLFDCVMVHTIGSGSLLAFGASPSDDGKSVWLFLKFGGTGNRFLIDRKNIISCTAMRLGEVAQ